MSAPSVENVTILVRKHNLQQLLVTNNLLLVVVGDPLHATSVLSNVNLSFNNPWIQPRANLLHASIRFCVYNFVLVMNIAEIMLIDINPKNLSIEQCIVRRRT
jgi:hypothetical protein